MHIENVSFEFSRQKTEKSRDFESANDFWPKMFEFSRQIYKLNR